MEELLEKIPPEKRWEITAKTLARFFCYRGEKLIAPQLGVGKDIISPLWSKEKWQEINDKVIGDAAKQSMRWVKEMFNIPVEDAIGAVKLLFVGAILSWGPEVTFEIVEQTPERAEVRHTKCPWWETYEEYEVDPEFRWCTTGHQVMFEKGFKAINPKLTFKLTKAFGWGDPYCEAVIEFKEE